MLDFTKMDDGEIVTFLARHIGEFTDDPSPDFPRNIRLGLKGGHLVVRKNVETFAIVARNSGVSYRPPHAELVFLYSDPAARGQGKASELIESIKADPDIVEPIKLLCCGDERHRFFERHAFNLANDENGIYAMWYPAPVAGN
ncbi:hypothetical protein [Pseudoduganella violacea]|uniref:GNAT superfamily N-acetyltransferase n=1 Tax=Pseudoduganella violacea TaxID=1715466 RepID=A0A7W5BFZ5_9BURK|nr:hypothetical protein [Pseudoduganella violacea]MBB3122484.1 GNAT superfamily N-acetyltransferase [Pseudoduganella violacea]